MVTLAGKNAPFIGRSSGIGYGVAKAALLSRAAHAIIGSSSQKKIAATLSKLQSKLYALGHVVEGKVTDDIVNVRSSESVKALLTRVGEVEQLGLDERRLAPFSFPEHDSDQNRDTFDVSFWGAFMAAQVAKLRPDGSIALAIGTVVIRPHGRSWQALRTALTPLRADLQLTSFPTRVKVVNLGLVKTEARMPLCL